jgi:hypothetical protein
VLRDVLAVDTLRSREAPTSPTRPHQATGEQSGDAVRG